MASGSLLHPRCRGLRHLIQTGPCRLPDPVSGLGQEQVHDWGSGCHWEVWGLCTFHVDSSEPPSSPHP